MDQNTEKAARLKARRRKWIIRSVIAAAGLSAGYICPQLPETHQALCHLGAKILALLAGGS